MSDYFRMSSFARYGLYTILVLIFSGLPLIAALTMDKTSLWLTVLTAWYAVFPPVILFLLAARIHRNPESRVVFTGQVWIPVGLWFLAQHLLGLFSEASIVITLLNLPAILVGKQGFVAGTAIFLIGGWALSQFGPKQTLLSREAIRRGVFD